MFVDANHDGKVERDTVLMAMSFSPTANQRAVPRFGQSRSDPKAPDKDPKATLATVQPRNGLSKNQDAAVGSPPHSTQLNTKSTLTLPFIIMADKDIVVVEGPDLNASKPPLDKKVYRQIMLPNGLRCVLISDVVAMLQDVPYKLFDEGYYDSDSDNDNQKEPAKTGRVRRGKHGNAVVDNDDDDNDNSVSDLDDDNHDDNDDDEATKDEEDDDDDDDDVGDGLRDAAAAMVVGVGSMFDPPEAQGLAHFLEHMLFMGTQKYPTENAYDAFLSKHGGSDNAYTEMECTVYHLEIAQERLDQAVDMFAQFFIHPLLSEGAVERELNAVDSEFQLNKNSDASRIQQLLCHTSGHTAAAHPFATFSWGNRESLRDQPERAGVDVMKLLRDFYNQVRT